MIYDIKGFHLFHAKPLKRSASEDSTGRRVTVTNGSLPLREHGFAREADLFRETD